MSRRARTVIRIQRASKRKRRMGMIQNTMWNEVPEADVVITNPTHLAVALKYDRAKMKAPKVLAKGARYNALLIREIAEKNGVPSLKTNHWHKCSLSSVGPARRFRSNSSQLWQRYWRMFIARTASVTLHKEGRSPRNPWQMVTKN